MPCRAVTAVEAVCKLKRCRACKKREAHAHACKQARASFARRRAVGSASPRRLAPHATPTDSAITSGSTPRQNVVKTTTSRLGCNSNYSTLSVGLVCATTRSVWPVRPRTVSGRLAPHAMPPNNSVHQKNYPRHRMVFQPLRVSGRLAPHATPTNNSINITK